MPALEALLENPSRALELLELDAPASAPDELEPVGAYGFHNGPFNNWDNWINWTNS